jgi:hypothetical protein
MPTDTKIDLRGVMMELEALALETIGTTAADH